MMRLFDIRRRVKQYPTLPYPALLNFFSSIPSLRGRTEFNKATEGADEQTEAAKGKKIPPHAVEYG